MRPYFPPRFSLGFLARPPAFFSFIPFLFFFFFFSLSSLSPLLSFPPLLLSFSLSSLPFFFSPPLPPFFLLSSFPSLPFSPFSFPLFSS
ncbi:hypothetical protein ACXWR7_10010, partial [Streptococcus pyogenes]